MSDYLKNFLRFCLIITIQVLILNKIPLRWWSQPMGFPLFIPMLYPLFILLLPFRTPLWLILILGFVTGLTIDTFMNTAGMHALATTVIAFLRPFILNALLPRNQEEYAGQSPGLRNMGWFPFLTYSFFLILIHHSVYFIVELWSLKNIGYLFLKILASTLTTILFVISYLLLFTRQNAR